MMPFPLKYVTIQPVTLFRRILAEQETGEQPEFFAFKEALIYAPVLFMAFVSAGVTQKVSHSRKPQDANTSMGTAFPAFMPRR